MRISGGSRWRLVVAGALGVVLVVMLVLGGNGLLKVWRLKQKVDTLERDVQMLEAENDRLARTIDRLREDPAAIEKIAREELGLVREGEKVLKFPAASRPIR